MAPTHSSTIIRIGSAPIINRAMLPPLLAGIVVLVALSIFFVWSRQRVLNLEYDIASLESGIRNARQETTRLKLEVAMLRQPTRIEQLAREEFDLVMPDPRKIIVVH